MLACMDTRIRKRGGIGEERDFSKINNKSSFLYCFGPVGISAFSKGMWTFFKNSSK